MGFLNAVSEIFQRVYPRWVAQLGARFSRLSPHAIEDAVSTVFIHALERPAFQRSWIESGSVGLEALLRTAAWRAVNTTRKTDARRRGLRQQWAQPACDALDPERIASARAEHRALAALVPDAVRQFGGRQPESFERALCDRLAGGSDTECARQHGVRREPINRARRWLRDQLRS